MGFQEIIIRKGRIALKKGQWLQRFSLLLVFCMFLAIIGCSGGKNPIGASSGNSLGASSLDNADSGDVSGDESGTGSNDDSSDVQDGSTLSSSSTSSQKSSTSSTKVSNGLPENYKEFVFATSVYVNDYQSLGSNARSDLMMEKFAEIEGKYGIKVRIKAYPEADSMVTDITLAINSGTQPFDVLETRNARARQLMSQGVVTPQSGIKSIDVKDKRFAQSLLESMTFSNKVYATTIDGIYNAATGVFYNKNILKSMNLSADYIYNLYKSGKWTFDAFRKLARDATRGEGENKIWGILGATSPIGLAISANAGGTVIRKSNGKFDVALASAGGIEAMNWIHEMWAKDKSFYFINDHVTTWEKFATGKFLMFPTWLSYIQYFVEYGMEDEIGFVPFPIGPRQTKHITNAYEYNCIVMPTGLKYPEAAGKIYMDIASVSSKLENLCVSQLKDYGLDDKSIGIYKEIFNYIQPEFSQGVNFSTTKSIDDSVFTLNGDPASVAASIKKKMQIEVEEFYSKISK